MAITFLNTGRPKNASVAMSFTSGTLGAGNNILSVYTRYIDANNYLLAEMTATNASTSIRLVERTTGTDNLIVTATGGALTNSTSYFFYVVLSESTITASVVAGTTALGSTILTTGPRTVAHLLRGTVGYDSTIVASGFTLPFVREVNSEYANFESTSFPSVSPIKGALLSANTSLPNDLISGATLIASGDATSLVGSIGKPEPSIRVIRSGAGAAGGVKTSIGFEIGTSAQVTIKGDLYPATRARGPFQIRLADVSNNTVFTGAISTPSIDQWNSFVIPITLELIPPALFLYIEETGMWDDEFFVDNLKVLHSTIGWQASVDDGVNWYRFLEINKDFSGIHFGNAGNRLRVKATAFVDTAWIQGYKITPVYGMPGQIVYTQRFLTREIRTIGAVTTSARAQDIRQTAIGTTSVSTQNIRATGKSTSFIATSIKTVGSASSSRAQDIRITG